ncbi:zonular occludens toxin family protein [Chitinolyticbacter meiyuanensis]|uniref:zonular occludens toxin family protein n=1 Tax=Chitinolyticbacter meiyuanensis TaxID=682798 RepID=UPI0011E58C4B|nr:zonular occludens toxin domain-containing protein [Chitinolyticbacter meiyuanensis]
MSILIYHGPPGAYKTSSAVQDQVLPAVKHGRKVEVPIGEFDADGKLKTRTVKVPRIIVTNVRGLSRDTCIRYYGSDLSAEWLDGFDLVHDFGDRTETVHYPGFDVINIDTSLQEGRDRMARWFHWVPIGAFLIIDEAQNVWPSRWTARDLTALDYPADGELPGVDAAKRDGRPADFVTAFDMHRHFNWDLVLTTPKISKIRDDIRGASEGAYSHRNLAVLSALFKGNYTQGYHDAQDDGRPAQLQTIQRKRINQRVFKVYQSTATGLVADTKAGTSIFKDPKVVGLLICVALPVIYFAFAGVLTFPHPAIPRIS